MSTDILFINPGHGDLIYQELSKEFTAVAPPLWCLLLAGGLINKGYSCAIYDVNVEGWDKDKFKSLLYSYNPSLIVILAYGHHPSASTQTMVYVRKIVSDIKSYNKDLFISLGGTHPSSLPKKTLQDEDVDFIIIGEGLYQIENLYKFVKGKKNLKDIRGIAYREDDQIRINQPEDNVIDLDNELPFYPWELLKPLTNYRAHNMHCFQYFESSKSSDFIDVRSPYATIYTSLGCPYNCDFCCIKAIYNKPGIRFFSTDKILKDIDTLYQKHNVRNIRLDDELFVINKNRVLSICDKLMERRYDLNIMAYARIDTLNGQIVKSLKRAGFSWICIGYEAGTMSNLVKVNKKISTNIFDITDLVRKEGLYILGNFIFGFPDENLETMEETFQTAVKLNCEFVNFYCMMAYPGSKLYELYKDTLPTEWISYSQHSYYSKPLPTKYLSSKEVLYFRDNAFYRYFENPSYRKMIENKFGSKVLEHIDRMLSIKIKRKLLEDVG